MYDMEKLTIVEVKDKFQWQDLNERAIHKTFLQSWAAKEWREAMGQKIHLLGVSDGAKLVAGASLTEMPLIKRWGIKANFLFLPHGPIIDEAYWSRRSEILSILISEIREIYQKNKSLAFARIQPAWPDNPEDRKIFRELGLIVAPIFIVPEITWCLNITPAEDELLKGMRKTTRYLIRKGLNNPKLSIKKGKDKSDLNDFLSLYRQTVGRHRFRAFSLDYLEKELEHLSREDEILVLNAYYEGRPIASAMIVFHQGTAYYHQGASENEQPKDAPGSYLIQWEAIREAKRRGCQIYNFWGIAHSDNPRHGYHGLTLFKKGFGGYRLDYLPTQDLIFNWLYWPNYLVEKYRRRQRRI